MSGKKIIVLSGGTSAEREVSLKSGSQIHSALIQLGRQVELEDLLTINQINYLKKNNEYEIDLIFNNNALISLGTEAIEVRLEDQTNTDEIFKF